MKMKKDWPVHMLYIILMIMGLYPVNGLTHNGIVFACMVTAAEILYLLRKMGCGKSGGNSDLMFFFYAVLIVWEGVTDWFPIASPILLPSPRAVFQVFIKQRRLMIRGVYSSFQLLFAGFGAAFFLGVPLGIISGRVRRIREFLLPAAKIACCIPPIIYTPYVVAVMPSFRSASVFVIVMGLFWPVFMNVVLMVSSMPQTMEDTVRSMRVGKWDLFAEIYLPYVLPGVVKSLHISLSTSFMLLTMAEMMGASSGLGYFIKNFADYGNYTCVLAGIILTAAVILLLNLFLDMLEKRCIRWKI